MEEYPSNSYRSREYNREPASHQQSAERKRLNKVAQAKKNGSNAFSKAMHLDDDVAESLWTYIFDSLIGSTFKDIMYKIITNIAHAVIFKSLTFDNKADSSGYRSYRSFSDDRSKASRVRENDYGTLSRYPTCDILIEDRVELEEVINQLEDTLSEYGTVTIGDLYDSVGWDTYSTYYNYGWKDLSGMKINTTIGGYVLHMPKPMQIN